MAKQTPQGLRSLSGLVEADGGLHSSSSTFTHNMLAFGLNKKLCSEFLKKQAVIGNLDEGELGSWAGAAQGQQDTLGTDTAH